MNNPTLYSEFRIEVVVKLVLEQGLSFKETAAW
jgi:hypothetical protein